MNNSRNLLLMLSRRKAEKSHRSFHIHQVLNNRRVPSHLESPDFTASLFYTNLPNKRRERKVKVVDRIEPVGPLIIDCKNKALNFYGGRCYGKYDVIPLASKGWTHRKAKGDYFTILPTNKYSPFLTKEELPTEFEEYGISKNIIEQLKKLDVNYPTVIQAKLFQKLLAGDNVCTLAECGSGKTIGYLIAMIENILKWKDQIPENTNSPLGIIILPTRESVLQLSNIAIPICSALGLTCQPLMSSFVESLRTFASGGKRTDILICNIRALTRGKKKKFISTKYTKHVVVDDVQLFETKDKFSLLETFFKYSDLNFSGLNNNATLNSAQICFVTATMPAALEEKLRGLIQGNNYEKITTPHIHKLLFNVPQKFMRLSKRDMPVALLEHAKKAAKKKIPTLIFSNKLPTANWVSLFLKENGMECLLASKQQAPNERLDNLKEFESGNVNLISATNILSHGVHFPKLKQIISYEFPLYMPDYISRCGRVGRLNQDDDCLITHFISRKVEVPIVQNIEKAVRINGTLPRIFYPRKHLSETSGMKLLQWFFPQFLWICDDNRNEFLWFDRRDVLVKQFQAVITEFVFC